MFGKIKYNLNIYRQESDVPQLLDDILEVRSRYKKIRDHRPRASKKLTELGLLIGSAYKINIIEANEMWDYLIDLNVKDNPEYVNFYIISVFRKICLYIGEEDSIDLLRMSETRMLYFWKVMPINLLYYNIFQPVFFNGNLDKTKEVFCFCNEGLKGTQYELTFYSKMFELLMIEDNSFSNDEKEYVILFLEYILNISSNSVTPIIKMILISKERDEYCNLEILDACIDALSIVDIKILCKLFLKILSIASKSIDEKNLVTKWICFFDKCKEHNNYYPDDLELSTKMGGTVTIKANFKLIIDGVEINSGEDDTEETYTPPVTSTPEYEQSGTSRLVNLLLDNEELLTRYFSVPLCLNIKRNAVYHWIIEKQWEQLIKYMVLNFSSTPPSLLMSFGRGTFEILEPFISNSGIDTNSNVTMSKWNEDNYGRDWKIIDQTNREDFKNAIITIYKECQKCECGPQLLSAIEEYGFELRL